MKRTFPSVMVALAMSSWGDTGPRVAPATECRADSECVVTTFDGCCGACCPPRPHAMSAAALREAEERCAEVKCAARRCDDVACAMVVPEPASGFRAVCEAGRCVAHKVTEVAECRRDADCAVLSALPPAGAACHQSPCGCCPVTVAVPVEGPRPAPAGPKGSGAPGAPSFGLSTADGQTSSQTRRPPRCPPCATPRAADAACVAGKCTLVAPKPKLPPAPPE